MNERDVELVRQWQEQQKILITHYEKMLLASKPSHLIVIGIIAIGIVIIMMMLGALPTEQLVYNLC